jgi:hypothetical protein
MALLLSVFIQLLNASSSYLELAKFYAPIIHQELGTDPVADEFTRVDFDGDWNPFNNWQNLESSQRPREVYWALIESEKHYFLTYAFFFPRDYSWVCFWVLCHENDFEGLRVVIRKPDKIVALETLAHNYRTEIKNPKQIEVMMEWGGHGVIPLVKQRPHQNNIVYLPSHYRLRSLDELWQKRKSFLFNERGHFNGDDWIFFGKGAAKPPWKWEIWDSDLKPGEWFLDPLKLFGDEGEKYLLHQYREI